MVTCISRRFCSYQGDVAETSKTFFKNSKLSPPATASTLTLTQVSSSKQDKLFLNPMVGGSLEVLLCFLYSK